MYKVSAGEIHGTLEAQFGVDMCTMWAVQDFCRTIRSEGELLTGLLRSGGQGNRQESTLLFAELEKALFRSLRPQAEPPSVSFSAVLGRLQDPLG
jgi:hypothetical protein